MKAALVLAAAFFICTGRLALAETLPQSSAIPAKWEARQLVVSCPTECNFREEMEFILERLGARDLSLLDKAATFSALIPAGKGEGDVAGARNVFARWETVTFRRAGGRYGPKGGIVLYEAMKDRILPLFTTRNLKEESGGRMSVEVLLPVGSGTSNQSEQRR